MKKFPKYLLIFLLSSCTMYKREDAGEDLKPVIEDLIKDKAVSGLRIEIIKLPPAH